MGKIEALINTSVQDCQVSIGFITDLEFLRQLLARCLRMEMKTRSQVVARRIRQVEKGAVQGEKKQGERHGNN